MLHDNKQSGGRKRLECLNAMNRCTETLAISPWERKFDYDWTTFNCGWK